MQCITLMLRLLAPDYYILATSSIRLLLSLCFFPSRLLLYLRSRSFSPLYVFGYPLPLPPCAVLMGTAAFFPIRRPFSLFGARKCPARGSDMRREEP